jgi:hypothetical protein
VMRTLHWTPTPRTGQGLAGILYEAASGTVAHHAWHPSRYAPVVRSKLGTLLAVLLLGALAAAAVLLYLRETEKDRQIAEQKRIIQALEQRLDRSWAEELVADVRVDALTRDPDGGGPEMTLTFAQYQPGTETPALRKTMTLPGEEFYIDGLVVQFERKLVEEGDGLRGKSLLFFRRAFGDRQKPVDGVPLYRQAAVASEVSADIPESLRVDSVPSEFERQIWSRFWTYANDPALAASAGIRVAQGEAVHTRAVRGQVYKVTLGAGHGLSLVPRLPGAMVGDAVEAGGR